MRRNRTVNPRTNRFRAVRLGQAWLVLTLLLVGCSNPFAVPIIDDFSASPDTLAEGGTTEVTLTWTVANADTLQLTSDRGLSLDVSGTDSYAVAISAPTKFTLTARNLFSAVTSDLEISTTAPEDPGGEEPPGEEPPGEEPPGEEPPGEEPPGEEPDPSAILILIAGQSNAAGRGLPFPEGKAVADDGVYMLSEGSSQDDWRWVTAAEPSDTFPEAKAHSFLVTLGNELRGATGREVYLVQAAVGGTNVSSWLPGAGSGYFENAVDRAEFAASDLGVPVSAVAWFQGESDSQTASQREQFASRTEQVFEAFHDDLPGAPPILFVQLARRLLDEEPERNLAYQAIRESQRSMDPLAESTAVVQPGGAPGPAGDAPQYFRLVVAHDLQLSDDLHVGSAGQKVLGERLAHAFLVDFWDGEGARPATQRGPRLVRIERASSNTLRVVVSRPINSSATYGSYFTVLVDGSPVGLTAVGRDSGTSSAIVLTTASALPTELGRIAVRYMPPNDGGPGATSSQAVHAVDSGILLPLPAFGKPGVPVPASFLQAY